MQGKHCLAVPVFRTVNSYSLLPNLPDLPNCFETSPWAVWADTPPNSEIICVQNIGTKVVLGIFFLMPLISILVPKIMEA